MPEKDPNLEGGVDISDLSSISLDDVDDVLDSGNEESLGESTNTNLLENALNENVFLDSGEEKPKIHAEKEGDNLGSYLRRFFFAGVLSFLGVLAIVLFYSFDVYITQASKTTVQTEYQNYVSKYKDNLKKVKSIIGLDNASYYTTPNIGTQQGVQEVNEIINASDIDYIEKKDLLSDYVSNIIKGTEDQARLAEDLRQNIAKQGFLPQELEVLLSENETIDTIQRSLNALEIIKFSTATKVFSYMNTALVTILEMVKMSGINVDTINQLFAQINSRGEQDITSYVYMCYLNPFEVSANCDTIGDLDLYYSITNDKSINIKLFKNVMNAISQLLEKEDTTLFSITFKGFNAQSKNISFNIEVYTNQEDEKNLMAQGKRNPNIFILTNIINLLKQSSFIIGAEINTNEINVDTRTVNRGGVSRTVNYSSMDFTVPIQKGSEREIFDYINLDNLENLLTSKGIKVDSGKDSVNPEIKDTSINDTKGNNSKVENDDSKVESNDSKVESNDEKENEDSNEKNEAEESSEDNEIDA